MKKSKAQKKIQIWIKSPVISIIITKVYYLSENSNAILWRL